jgi:hypothetical protein
VAFCIVGGPRQTLSQAPRGTSSKPGVPRENGVIASTQRGRQLSDHCSRRPVASVASSINHPGNVALRTPDATLSEGRSPSVNRTCPARGKPPKMPFR